MLGFFVPTVFLTATILAVWLYKAGHPKVRGIVIFTPMGLVLLHELFFTWPPLLVDFWQEAGDAPWIATILLSALVALGCGYFFGVRVAPGLRAHLASFHGQKLVDGPASSRGSAVVAMTACLVLCGLLLYRGVPPALTNLKSVVTGGYAGGANEAMAFQRLSLTKGHHFGGSYRGQGVLRWVNRIGWPFISAIAIIRFGSRKTVGNLAMALATVLGGFAFIAGDGTRGPFLWSLVTLMVVLSLHFRITTSHLLAFMACLLLALFTLSLTQKLSGVLGNGGGSQAAIEKLADRLFLGNGANANDVIRFVDAGLIEKRYGQIHKTDLAAALPFISSDLPFTYEVFLLQNPSARTDRTTFASMTYLGRLYAEGGLPVVTAGFFLIGVLCACLTVALETIKTPETIASNGIMIMSIGQLPLNGLVYCVMSLIVLLMVRCVFRFLSRPSYALKTHQANARLARSS